jgi:tetratricopeptide (TPR) repeat protein
VLTKRARSTSARGVGSSAIALGQRIRRARQSLGLSLAAVAGTDFSRAFLNQVELGRAQPSTHTLRIIAERLQQPLEYFLEDPEVSSSAVELTLAEAETRLLRADPKRAQTLLEQLLRHPIPLEPKTHAQLLLAEAWLRLGNRTAEAIGLLEGAHASAVQAGWIALQVECCDRLGTAHYLARRPHEAGRWFDLALERYRHADLKDPVLKARILGHQANLHFLNGRPHEAIATYEAAIEAAEPVADISQLAGIYEGLAMSFQQAGQLGRALTYAQRSLRLFETVQDVRMSAQLRNNMADMLLQQGRPVDAETVFCAGAAQLAQVGDRELRPYLLAGAAEAALEQGAMDRASRMAEEALRATRDSSDPLAATAAHRVAGRIAHRLHRRDESHGHFETALRLSSQAGAQDTRARVEYDFGCSLEEQGDHAAAATHFRQAYDLRQPAGA